MFSQQQKSQPVASWLIANPLQPATARYSRRTWAIVLGCCLIVHYILFAIVHNLVDMRACTRHLPDPLYRFIPFNPRWSIVADDLYSLVSTVIVLALVYQAFRGKQFPILRLGIGISIQSLVRAATLLAFPACRSTIALGTPGPLRPIALTDPHFYALGFRGFAVNDLVFSGHTGFFLLFLYVTAAWPKSIRVAIAIFTLVMIYALLATREHYTIDILIAFPVSYLADRLALKLLPLRNQPQS